MIRLQFVLICYQYFLIASGNRLEFKFVQLSFAQQYKELTNHLRDVEDKREPNRLDEHSDISSVCLQFCFLRDADTHAKRSRGRKP